MISDILPDRAALEHPLLRFWSGGASRVFSRRAFWALVAHYVRMMERLPSSDGISVVIAHTSPEQMALFIAAITAGRLAAIFPPNTPLQEESAFFEQQRQSLNKIDPERIYILSEKLAETIARIDPSLGAKAVLVPADTDESCTDTDILDMRARFRNRLLSEHPIFVQHSSGTTGIKKAVSITGIALAAQFQAYWPMLRQACGAPALRIASWLPLYHDMGLLTSLLMPILGDDTISIVDPFEWIARPDCFLQMIEQDQCDAAWMPNFAYRHFVRLKMNLQPRALNSVRLWVDCSEPCRYADAAAFETSFAEWGVPKGSVVGCYAMAETVFAASMCLPGEQRGLALPYAVEPGAKLADFGAAVFDHTNAAAQTAARLILSSGRALPDIEIAVLVDGKPAAEGVYGEIALRGAYLFAGYRGMNAENANIGEDGFYRSGDLGTIIDGHVFVFGRLKEIIIVNGKNLFVGDIEDAIGRVPGVKKGRAVAFGMESAQTGSEELIVIAEKNAESDMPPATTRMEINRLISDMFMIKPRDIRVVEDRWLVKSTSGKISRSDNLQKYIQVFRTKAPS